MKIGITLGDPSGVGPEIIARALGERPELARRARVFGDRGVLERAGLPVDLPVEIVEVTRLAPDDAQPGRPSDAGAAAQVAYLRAAVADPAIAALVTAPISKTQVQKVGFGFPGHTEFFAAHFGAREHAMAFFGRKLRVVLATIHVPLLSLSRELTADAVARAIFLGGATLASRLRIPRPKITVLGLNPHAGEGGLFGREEIDVIAPGIEAGRARLHAAGVQADVGGPAVPDAAYRKPADLFVAMYHDQALIPVKLIDFEDAVNVTLGLPVVRTSPDHGVAYDIAGKDLARHGSFRAALDLAAKML
jgi:4-hydroxythreonine-4-phosphate dehydrogenase